MSPSSPSPSSQSPPRSLSEIRDLVALWKSSGLGQAEWCEARGMKRSTLAWYVKRVRLATPRGFIALRQQAVPSAEVASSPREAGNLVLDMSHGLRISGLQVADVVELARALAEVAS